MDTMETGTVLTLHDRCDGCGAAAKVRTILTTDQTLQWCSHHWNEAEHSPKLQPLLAEIIDERGDPDGDGR